MFLIPAAQGWNVVSAGENGAAWIVQGVATLDETLPLLNGTKNIVLGLPASAVLAQRLRLPTLEAGEFSEMVRLQIEKALPYPPEEVTTDFEVIEQTEEGSVVSAVSVHNTKLSELAAPLLTRGIIPAQVGDACGGGSCLPPLSGRPGAGLCDQRRGKDRLHWFSRWH